MGQSITEYFNQQPVKEEQQRVDEFLLTVTAACLFAYCCAPLLNSGFAKGFGSGLGALIGGLGGGLKTISSMFGGDDSKKDDKNKENIQDASAGFMKMNSACQQLKKVADDEKDEEKRTEMQKTAAALTASTTGQNGELLPPEKWAARYKELTGNDPADGLKGVMEGITDEELKKAGEQLDKNLKSNTKEMTYDQFLEELKKAQSAAVETATNLKSILDARTPEETDIAVKANDECVKVREEYRKQVAEAKTDEEKAKLKKDFEEKLNGIKDKAKKDASAARDKQIKKLDDEYKDKIDKAKSDDEKKKLQDELSKKKEDLTKPADGGSDPKGGGGDGEPEGTTSKEEEVVDKETGKKVKRIVYTGPQGGRYYYPDGVPHTPENKVYVESAVSLSTWLSQVFD